MDLRKDPTAENVYGVKALKRYTTVTFSYGRKRRRKGDRRSVMRRRLPCAEAPLALSPSPSDASNEQLPALELQSPIEAAAAPFPAASGNGSNQSSPSRATIEFSLRVATGSRYKSGLAAPPVVDIVDRLDITDAARTRILARRWKEIPAMLPKILLTVGPSDDVHNRGLTCDDVARANATVLGATRSMLESRTTSLCTINLLRLRFFLGDGTLSIGQTVANTMVTEKVGSAELTLYTMKEGRRCTDDDVLTYGKQFKSFLDACPNAFSGVARLQLENLRLAESSGIPEIFSICKRLEFLRLFNCDMGFLSLLEVSHSLLRELEFVRCNFERVDLKWLPKLTMLTFSWWVGEHDPLSLDYVPLLQTLSITHMARLRHKVLKLSEFLGKATISHLNLNYLCEKIWVKPEESNQLLQVFHKLRHVTLTHISEECDLTWTLFILQGAPSLQELCIKVWDHLCEMIVDGEQRRQYGFSEDKKDAHVLWRAPASDFKHHNLSVLMVFGF